MFSACLELRRDKVSASRISEALCVCKEGHKGHYGRPLVGFQMGASNRLVWAMAGALLFCDTGLSACFEWGGLACLR